MNDFLDIMIRNMTPEGKRGTAEVHCQHCVLYYSWGEVTLYSYLYLLRDFFDPIT